MKRKKKPAEKPLHYSWDLNQLTLFPEPNALSTRPRGHTSISNLIPSSGVIKENSKPFNNKKNIDELLLRTHLFKFAHFFLLRRFSNASFQIQKFRQNFSNLKNSPQNKLFKEKFETKKALVSSIC